MISKSPKGIIHLKFYGLKYGSLSPLVFFYESYLIVILIIIFARFSISLINPLKNEVYNKDCALKF